MQQLNILPVNVSQSTDFKDESNSSDVISDEANSHFSALVEQHIAEPKNNKSTSKPADKNSSQISNKSDYNANKTAMTDADLAVSGNESEVEAVSKVEKEQSKEANTREVSSEKNLDEQIENSASRESSKNSEVDQQALEQSKQLMALLQSSDKTLVEPIETDIQNEELAADNATVKKSKSANDENKVTTLSVNDTDKKALLEKNNVAKVLTDLDNVLMNNKLANEEVIKESASETGKSTKEQQSTVTTDLRLNSAKAASLVEGDEKVLTNIDKNENLAIKEQLKNQQVLADKALSSSDTLTNSLSKANNVLEGEEEIIEKNMTTGNNTRLAETERIEASKVTKSVVESLKSKKTTVISPAVISQNEKLSATVAKNTLASETVVKDTATDKGTTDDNFLDKVASQSLSTQNSEQVNKPVSSHISQQLKADAVDKVISSDVQDDTGENLTKALNAESAESAQVTDDIDATEEKIKVNTTKQASSQNPNLTSVRHFTDVSANATQLSEGYIAQQSAEALNHNVANDVAQIQKNNVQLQQETLSIFRKDFADAVKDKVMLVISQKLQQFDIILDPPELGNMQVRVNLQGEQAAVNFVVQNQQAKDALEQNMQKLKDMLSEQGVDVGDASVEQQSQQASDNNQGRQQNSSLGNNEKELAQAQTVLSANLFKTQTTAIDYYA
ncbi:MAG: flagellar hook-length control protein FliK [Colwellia sp.]